MTGALKIKHFTIVNQQDKILFTHYLRGRCPSATNISIFSNLTCPSKGLDLFEKRKPKSST